MFNTMTMVKVIGGVGGALLIFLLSNLVAESLYSTESGHGEEMQAYSVDTGEGGDEATQESATDEPSFEDLLAAADPAKGEKTFGKCKACHKLEQGANATGPYLYGVVGRDVASVADFGYSDTLKGLGGQWTPDRLNEFLTKPKDYAPGTKMGFSGLKKITDRANLIAYLATIGG
ncbi:MAG TPA: cytochrome c family protein [Rhodobacteraceae bacterium]|nr:cytochrome c family protein [Paracoccaceae bacterium]